MADEVPDQQHRLPCQRVASIRGFQCRNQVQVMDATLEERQRKKEEMVYITKDQVMKYPVSNPSR